MIGSVAALYFGVGIVGAIANVYAIAYQNLSWSIRYVIHQTLILIFLWPMFTWIAYRYRNDELWVEE